MPWTGLMSWKWEPFRAALRTGSGFKRSNLHALNWSNVIEIGNLSERFCERDLASRDQTCITWTGLISCNRALLRAVSRFKRSNLHALNRTNVMGMGTCPIAFANGICPFETFRTKTSETYQFLRRKALIFRQSEKVLLVANAKRKISGKQGNE